MSYQVYASEAPKLFSAAEGRDSNGDSPKTPENGTSQGNAAPSKGFVDIVEFHKETLAGREIDIIPTERFLPARRANDTKARKYDEYAVVLRRTWMQKGESSFLVRLELEMRSEALCAAFRRIAVSTFEETDLNTFPIKLQSPFKELFFYREKIAALAADESADPALRREMGILEDFVQNNGLMSSIVQDHERYAKEGYVVGDMVWTAYPPNSLVVLDVGGGATTMRECWICRNVVFKQTREGAFWVVTGLRIGFDGSSPGLVRQSFTFPFMGMQVSKIAELPIVPLGVYKGHDALAAALRHRAERLRGVLGVDFSSFACEEYVGAAWRHSFSDYDTATRPVLHANQMDGRVIVDFKAYVDRHRDQALDLEVFKKPAKRKSQVRARGILAQKSGRRKSRRAWESDEDVDEDELEPEAGVNVLDFKTFETIKLAAASGSGPGSASAPNGDNNDEPKLSDLDGLASAVVETFNLPKADVSLLFPALVPAFGLKEKEWRWVLSDELRPLQWNREAFRGLQLEKVTKDLVEALVRGHKMKAKAFDDIVPGKGQGLIFMLHGKPGLGKTLTAESVADYLERPLYPISGGEISTDVVQAEQRLDDIFELTKRWSAVSLLDEADVLLCKRSSTEMDRNAIVAVFLRKIEYFQGVLFLTTNRRQDIDDAFKSRIHVTITYPDLSHGAQATIWQRLLEKNAQAVGVDGSWTEAVFAELGKLDLNGRTIKNILRTAVAYANADEKPLGARHALAIVRTELSGDDYINDDGEGEGALAAEGLRGRRDEAIRALQRLLE